MSNAGAEELLQQWISDFVDMYNRYPTEETLLDWEIKISIMHAEEYDE